MNEDRSAINQDEQEKPKRKWKEKEQKQLTIKFIVIFFFVRRIIIIIIVRLSGSSTHYREGDQFVFDGWFSFRSKLTSS
jgi:hypothetical protein